MASNYKQREPIRVEGDIAYIPLTQGKEAIVDTCVLPCIEHYKWYTMRVHNSDSLFYAIVCKKDRVNLMHRVLLYAPPGMVIDHINGNGLDNRYENLRVVSHAVNMKNRKVHKNNRSGMPGIRRTKCGTWHTTGGGKGRDYLGTFKTLEEAQEARAVALGGNHRAPCPQGGV